MGSADEVHVVLVEELGDHVGAEGEGDAAVVLAPAQHVLVGVGPQQVAQETLVGHVGGAHDPSHLFHGLQIRRQSCQKHGDFDGQRGGTRDDVRRARGSLGLPSNGTAHDQTGGVIAVVCLHIQQHVC